MMRKVSKYGPVGLSTAVLVGILSIPSVAGNDLPKVALETLVEGLTSPVALVSPPGDERRFIVDRTGYIYILDTGDKLLEEPFLDISDQLVDLRDSFDERGFLGLAFHPDFQENRRYYVYYSAPLRDDAPSGWDHTSIVSEFKAKATEAKGQSEPLTTEAQSERKILRIDQPQFNHNAGALSFGPDGYLYIALGDGGNAHDQGRGHPPLGNGQDVSTLLGSILRIDVDQEDAGAAYGIPSGNPFAQGGAGREEIYSWGWRNPWRMSFDRETGDLWVATNGQELWEAVYEASEPGNYGWNIMEGAHCFDPDNPGGMPPPDDCAQEGPQGHDLKLPLIEYPHPGNNTDEAVAGISVIGGYVYRGDDIPELEGRYIFGDWTKGFGRPQGQVFIASRQENDDQPTWKIELLQELDHFLIGFGQDSDHELYLLTTKEGGPTGSSGAVHKLVPAPK